MEETYEEPKPLQTPKHNQAPILAVRCENCIHFAKYRAKQFKDLCSNLGVQEKSRPCSYFFANPFVFKPKQEEFQIFRDMLSDLPKSKLVALLGMVQQEVVTRRTGFEFGDVVYVRVIGEDYLKNYASAIVVAANRTHVYVQGKRRKFTAMLLTESILTPDKWKRKKAALISRNRIRDPKSSQYYNASYARKRSIDETVPTIDQFNKLIKGPEVIRLGKRD